MFKRLLGGKKAKKNSSIDKTAEQTEDTVNVPIPVQTNNTSKSSRRKSKKEKAKGKQKKQNNQKGTNKLLNKIGGGKKSGMNDGKDGNVNNKGKLKKLKKGKKPQYKRIARPKPERKPGKVKRVSNKFYPADVNFMYTTPRENWLPCLGRNQEVDFGNSARIIRDVTDE